VGIELNKPLDGWPETTKKVQSIVGHISVAIGPMDLPIGPKDSPWPGKGQMMQKKG